MELPILKTFINFSRHHFCCFIVASLFVSDKSTTWNRCLQHPCFKNLCKIAQASLAENVVKKNRGGHFSIAVLLTTLIIYTR
jgi:hypothetical protein